MADFFSQYTTATSGTVTAQDTGQNVQLVHEAGLTLTLTIAFPANPVDGQTFSVSSVGGITTLTLTAVVGTIMNALSTLGVGGLGTWMYSLIVEVAFGVAVPIPTMPLLSIVMAGVAPLLPT